MSVLPVGMSGVGLFYGEDTCGVYFFYFDASGAVDNTFRIDKDADVGYFLPCYGVCFCGLLL